MDTKLKLSLLCLLLSRCLIEGAPNIVLIYTDDLDLALNTPELTLNKAKALIRDSGVEFTNAFATVPTCCPSRASTLTGRYQVSYTNFEAFYDV